MGAVASVDPVAEHEKARAALRAVIPRLARLLRAAPDLDAPSGVPLWTVGDTGAHLCAVYLAFCSAFTHEFAGWDGVLPPGDGPFAERITAVNAKSIGLLDADERRHLGDLVTERGERFLQVTRDLVPGTPVAAPWYGQQVVLTLANATGLMLSESLLHGLDVARGARIAWAIGADEARLVIGQAMPAVMPLALDEAKARGVRIAFGVVIKGGPRLAVVVDDGTATVTRDAPPRAYDCRITAEPTAFLLIGFRRTPLWSAIARGRIRAGGRRPWLALRLGELIAGP
ncbi:maleylpyruvate isomerase N-terminal domain-containing protein [Streptomyces sp. KLMMK]|uniref:maleylpyruvate isomerase N-terminal domain-containing protein n=1 Tax=Streptomyces sp. KLMMK TaxID=3109353 RepID=UPI003000F572